MWCPECRNEYKEGITECADCHVALVEELPPEKEKNPDIMDDNFSKWANQHSDLLEKIQETEEMKEAIKKGSPSIIDEASGEKIVDLDDVGSDIDMVEAAQALAHANASAKAYRPAEERAREFSSSAWTLLLVGSVGLLAVLLCVFGIIPVGIYGNSRYLTYGVMSVLFIIFLIVGIKSFSSAKKYEKEAEIEKVLLDDIHKWFFDSFDVNSIDSCLDSGEEEMVEIEKYYKRVDNIKHKILSKFTDLDEAFLEKIADDFFHELYE